MGAGPGRGTAVAAALGLLVVAASPLVTPRLTVAGVHTGYLHLAGVTSLLRNHAYPITQRPPLYSVVLAAVGIDMDRSRLSARTARETGNVQRLPVLHVLLEERFLNRAQWLNWLLWVATLALVAATVRLSCEEPETMVITLAAFAVPSGWLSVTALTDLTLSQFLLAGSLWCLCHCLRGGGACEPALAAAALMALAAVNRATYQLLGPVVAIAALFLARRRTRPGSALAVGVCLIVPWGAIVLGWSGYNYAQHSFFGLSSVMGHSLGTRAAYFLERARPDFPGEVPTFLRFRDALFTASPEHVPVFWPDQASQWLMTERGMTYVEAGAYLRRVSLAAIRRAPGRYLATVVDSAAHMALPYIPEWPHLLSIPAVILETCLLAAFLVSAALWAAFHVLPRVSTLGPTPCWSGADSTILLALLMFGYTLGVSCLIDQGHPYQRWPVHFTLGLVVALTRSRLRRLARVGAGFESP